MAYHETGTWPRWKLYLFVVAALITVMALFFGLGLALWAMILPSQVHQEQALADAGEQMKHGARRQFQNAFRIQRQRGGVGGQGVHAPW